MRQPALFGKHFLVGMASADDAAKRRGSPRGWLNNRLDKHRNSAPGFAEPPPPSSGHEVNPDANQYDELRLAELGRRRRSRQVDLSLTELRQSVAGLQAKFSRMESSTAQTAQSVQIIQGGSVREARCRRSSARGGRPIRYVSSRVSCYWKLGAWFADVVTE